MKKENYLLSSDYDENENHIAPEKLLEFLKKAIYLSDDEFNYKTINYKLTI